MLFYELIIRYFQLKKGIFKMYEQKKNHFKSPDLSQLQAVVIDHRTKIYIACDADPEKAKERYFARSGARKF